MFTDFHKYGIQFRYPEHWELGDIANDDTIIVSVNSPETSFWVVNLFQDCPDPQFVVDATISTLREEYEEIDVTDVDDHLFSEFDDFMACDLDFICLELTNSISLRLFRSQKYTVMILTQGTDHELETTKPILDQISESLKFD